jgi:predicted signal transduction protein with EAL and GGDEF domain
MSIATVAEYVETPEIQSRLVTLGVDYAQGFAVGRPRPLTELLEELPFLCSASVLPADAAAIVRHARAPDIPVLAPAQVVGGRPAGRVGGR